MSVAFLFSGQGAQYPGMLKEICERTPKAREVFRCADEVLGRSISDIAFYGTKEELDMTYNTQPCVLAADLAAYAAIIKHGIKPDVAAGFSLGEYAALIASGAISVEDGFRIVQDRAVAMQEAVPVGKGGMIAVFYARDEQVEQIMRMCKEISTGFAEVANFNYPGQIVISGDCEGLGQLKGILENQGMAVVDLPVSAPFHCHVMEPASCKLEKILSEIKISEMDFPVISNVDAKAYASKAEVPDKLVLQVKQPVLWQQTLAHLQKEGADTFIEVGPGKTLSSFVKKTLKDVKVFHINDMHSLMLTVTKLKQ